jgi:hypothetical protein
VGYIQNPHFLRGALYGAATRAAAAQRNQRVQPQPDMQDQGEWGSEGRAGWHCVHAVCADYTCVSALVELSSLLSNPSC